jgi:Flp pilus assembly protein TadG
MPTSLLKRDPTMRRKNSKVTRIIFHRAGAAIGALWADCRGVSAILTGLAATVLIGFAGIAIDFASWQATHRHMQGAADQAAIGAVIAYLAGGGTSPTTQAKAITANYGFTDGVSGVAVSVASVSPSPTGYDAAYTVSITQAQPQYFSSLFLSGITVGASAEAGTVTNGPCVLSLNAAASGAVTVSGSGTLTLTDCDMDVNSTSSSDAIDSGGACIFAQNINVGGGTSPTPSTGTGCTGGTIKYSGKYKHPVTTPDPYAHRTKPTAGSCPASGWKTTGATGTVTLSPTTCVASGGASCSSQSGYTINTGSAATTHVLPGTYCGGITVQASAKVSLDGPGVFVMNGGNVGFVVQGGTPATTVTSTGATIFLTAPGNGQCGKIDLSASNTSVTVTAPTSGATAGIAFWVDNTIANCPANTQVAFTGGATVSVTGAIYAPQNTVVYSGGSNGGNGCTQIVSDKLTISGPSYFQHNCGGTGVSDPASSARVALIQ